MVLSTGYNRVRTAVFISGTGSNLKSLIKFSKSKKFQIPIICVGNIYIGGTGKTPTSILIANQLSKYGKKPSIIKKFYKILAESALRAVRLCQPLKVPPTGYEKWKNIQLNFDPTEMLKG